MNKISNISHMYFTGGGLKGIVYLGIIRYLYLEDMVHKIKYIAGTSIGAFFGTGLALKIPIEILEAYVLSVVENIRKNLTVSQHNLPNLFENNGVLNLDFLINCVKHHLQETYNIDDITFIDFVKKTGVNLYVNAVCLNTTKIKTFCMENTPNVSVLSALRASMSIPYLFEPVCIEDEYYIDCISSDINFFNNVDKNSVLIVVLPKDSNKYTTIYPPKKEFNFLEHIFRVTEILLSSLFKEVPDSHEIFKLSDLPYDTYLKFGYTDKEIYVDITKQDMDDMIVKSFVDFSLYMNKRYKVYDTNI